MSSSRLAGTVRSGRIGDDMGKVDLQVQTVCERKGVQEGAARDFREVRRDENTGKEPRADLE
jgi:hypothetical protein